MKICAICCYHIIKYTPKFFIFVELRLVIAVSKLYLRHIVVLHCTQNLTPEPNKLQTKTLWQKQVMHVSSSQDNNDPFQYNLS